jgi:ParB family transcriptional regulator, chromosome partitioning protein
VNVRRGGLGRGLGALIPTGPGEDAIEGARFEELPLDSIEPNPRQPREVFDPDALAELVSSIREVGILQPVVVRELDPGHYQLIMGERRWRASRDAGLETVPAIIRDTPDTEMLRDALLENLHRQELNALEEAAAYAQLLEEFGATHEELADRVGRSRSHVTNTLRLLHLAPSVQRRVAAGVLSAGHARALLALDNAEAQEQLAARVVAEGLSVRAVEEIVAVGSAERTTPSPRTKQPLAPALAALADRLSDRLETRVSVDLGRKRGKVVIQFGSIDDLERIAGLLGVHPGHDDHHEHHDHDQGHEEQAHEEQSHYHEG